MKKKTLRTGKIEIKGIDFFPKVAFLKDAEIVSIVLLLRVYLEPRNKQLHKHMKEDWKVNGW